MEESKQEKLLNAIFGTEPKPKALRFSLNLEDVTVDVAIKKNKKNSRCRHQEKQEERSQRLPRFLPRWLQMRRKKMMSDFKCKPSYASEEEDWNAWRDEELIRDAYEEEKEVKKNESKD